MLARGAPRRRRRDRLDARPRGRPALARAHLPQGLRAAGRPRGPRPAAAAGAPHARRRLARGVVGRGDRVRGVPADGGAARARRRRPGRLPRQPQRAQPRRADPQHHAGAPAAHPEPLLRHVGRPAAAPGHGLGALRPPVPAAGARHRPHRPARARRPQPDGVERVAVDRARLPPAPSRARFSRRAARRDRPAPHRDRQGGRRAPLRAPRHRRRRAAGRRARAAPARRRDRHPRPTSTGWTGCGRRSTGSRPSWPSR